MFHHTHGYKSHSLQLELAHRPVGPIIPGHTFRVEPVPAPVPSDLSEGEVLLETLYISLDPAMRGWLDDVRSYVPPVQIGEVMRAFCICRVLASRSPKASPGDVVTAMNGIREIGILSDKHIEKPAFLPPGGKTTDLLGCLGMTGLTAYFGMMKIGNVKKGDTVVVSAAAGATGSVAVQIAKIQGAKKVIGTAGSDEKCRWLMEEGGVDVALNYRDPEFRRKFKEATREFVDVYFDNVGGEQLDMALARANKGARFVMCGGISQYNAKDKQGPKNIANVITMRIRMEGFIVFDYADEYPTALGQLAQWLAEGKLKRKETILKGGIRVADEGMVKLYQGGNIGKLLVEVKNPDEERQSKL